MKSAGMFLSFPDPTIGLVPQFVPFQYDPSDVTRVLKVTAGTSGGSGLRVGGPPQESYAFKLELDAHDLSATGAIGVGPLLAALEAMMEPGGGGYAALAGAIAALASPNSVPPVPAPSLPLVILVWGPERLAPVRIDSYSAKETQFNGILAPVHATVDLSVTVLRSTDLDGDQTLSNVMAKAYQVARTAMAIIGTAQGMEILGS